MPEAKDEYSEILEDHIGAESEAKTEEKQPEIEEKAKESEVKLDEKSESEEQPSVISKEFTDKHKLSDSFIGKSFDELAKTYKNQQKLDSKLSQQVASLNKEFSDLKTRLSAKEVKEVVKEVVEELPDFETEIEKFVDNDGYVNDRKGLAKFLKGYNELSQKLAERQFDKKLEDKTKEFEEKYSPTSKSVEDLKAKEYQAELYDEVKDGLGNLYETVDNKLIDDVFKQFGESLAEEDEETQKQMIELYRGKPKKFAKDILNYHKANRPPEKKSESEKVTEEVHKKQVEKLKNSDKKFTKVSTSARDQELQKSGDKDYDDLIGEAMEEAERFSESRSEVKRE